MIPPAVAQHSLDVLNEFGVDIWLFTNDQWLTRNPDGEYVSHEQRAIRHDPAIVADFTPYLTGACKIVGASSDAPLLARCEAAMKEAVGQQATAVRSQTYYLDITPPGHDKGTFVAAMPERLKAGEAGQQRSALAAEFLKVAPARQRRTGLEGVECRSQRAPFQFGDHGVIHGVLFSQMRERSLGRCIDAKFG